MNISTEIASYYKYGTNEEIVSMLKKAGFDACDFSMFLRHNDSLIDKPNYVELAKKLRRFADDEGIVFNQSHAPFWNASTWEKGFDQEKLTLLRRAVEVSGILGVKLCVVHPVNDYTASENAEYVFYPLKQTAKDCGVLIGLENMWNWLPDAAFCCPAACSSPEDFNAHLDLLDPEIFAACLDIGHAEMKGVDTSAEELIEKLGTRLKALHIHDNNKRDDSHLLPFLSAIDFDAMIQALKKIGYTGDVTLEAAEWANKFPKDLIPAAAKTAASVAEYLRERLLEK